MYSMCILLSVTDYVKCFHRDVGNNHLVGTIRELIRIEGCFPALRNLYDSLDN